MFGMFAVLGGAMLFATICVALISYTPKKEY
jgi:hypothetical protein